MRFKILGAVGVTVGGEALALGAPRQRALLARLLVEANRSLCPEKLISAIWGEATPQHPDAALQIVVSRLRNALGPAAGRLTSGPAGYRIEVADDELDLLQARRELARAAAKFEQNDFAGAADAADAALRRWNADAGDLGDVHLYDNAYRDVRALRIDIYELRTEAYLHCGRHVEVLADVDAWTRLEPCRETMRAQHMLALYRVGRRVDALAVYDDLRACLDAELAVEPSTHAQELHTRMREQDPALLAHRAGIAVPLPRWAVCGLPFVGRRREEQQIFARLGEIATGGAHLVLVEGGAGIGKSRLILEVARRTSDEAIVIAIDGADALRPGLRMVASALAEASTHLDDAELRLCLGRWPDEVAQIVPALRRRLPDLPLIIDADDEIDGGRICSALVSWISGLSQRAPVLFLIDDAHRAGPALLELVGELVAGSRRDPRRVLVIAAASSEADDRSSRLDQLARQLGDRGMLDRMHLGGLARDAVERMLGELAHPDTDRLAGELILATRGHPARLGEMLSEPDARPRRSGSTGPAPD